MYPQSHAATDAIAAELATDDIATPSLCLLRATSAACRPATLNVPQVDSVTSVMRRLLAACTVVLELHQAVQKAASQLSAQMSLTYFMPLSLTALAMLARTRVSLLHFWPGRNCCHVIAAALKQDNDCHATLPGHLGTSSAATCLTAKDLPLHAGADRSDAAGCLQGIQCPGHPGCCPASWTVQQSTNRQGCCILLLRPHAPTNWSQHSHVPRLCACLNPAALSAGALCQLPQMVSCSWHAGLPTLEQHAGLLMTPAGGTAGPSQAHLVTHSQQAQAAEHSVQDPGQKVDRTQLAAELAAAKLAQQGSTGLQHGSPALTQMAPTGGVAPRGAGAAPPSQGLLVFEERCVMVFSQLGTTGAAQLGAGRTVMPH